MTTVLVVVAAITILSVAIAWATWWVEKKDREWRRAPPAVPVVVVKEVEKETA